MEVHYKAIEKGVTSVDVQVGDKLTMKKPHPCGCNQFGVLRVGMDFRIKCEKCGHELMSPRSKIEKHIKSIDTSGRKID